MVSYTDPRLEKRYFRTPMMYPNQAPLLMMSQRFVGLSWPIDQVACETSLENLFESRNRDHEYHQEF